MANDQVDFELWLRSKFDGDALKAAQAEFRRTQKSAEDAGEGMKGIGGAAAGLKAALGELVAIAAILGELKEGFNEVTAQEQAFNRLSDAAARFGGSAGQLDEKFKSLATTIQQKSGLDDDSLYLHMVKVYQATGDMNEAMGQAALAADVARGANVPLEQALGMVNAAALGNTRSLRELGISIETTGDKGKDAEKALDGLRQRFGGAAEGAKGTTVALDKLKEEWGNVRNSFIEGGGELLGILLKIVNVGLQPLFISLELAGNSIKTIVGGFRGLGEVVSKAMHGDLAGAKEAAAKTLGDLKDGFEKSFDIIVERAQKMWATITGESTGSISAPKARGSAEGGGPGGAGGDGKERDLTAAEDELMRITAWERQNYLDRLKALEKFEASKVALRKRSAKETERIEKELDAERETLAEAQTKRILEEVRMRKAAAEAEKASQIDVASQGVAVARAAFGESKALAIADAIVNTYSGANQALGAYPPPYSFIMAALVVAMGIANVAKITSSEPSTQGTGFDDPSNDRAAYLGGRRWAADMIGEFTKGVSSGWASGMTAGVTNNTTNDNRRSYNVHLHGAGLIDPNNVQMVKQLKRTLDVIDVQIEGQRATARR